MFAKPVCILPPEYRQDEFYTKLIVGEQKQFVLIALFLILPHPYSSFLILLHPSSLLLTLPHSSSLYSGIRYGTALANKNSVILRCTWASNDFNVSLLSRKKGEAVELRAPNPTPTQQPTNRKAAYRAQSDSDPLVNLSEFAVAIISGSRFLRAANALQVLVRDDRVNTNDLDKSVKHLTKNAQEYCNKKNREGQVICVHSIDSAACSGDFGGIQFHPILSSKCLS